MAPPPPIELDGTTLEGGGQLFRNALVLSALTKTPIRISNVRGNRTGKFRAGSSTGKGGLKAVHAAGADWLARACGARVEGVEVGSRDVLFEPWVVGAKDGEGVWRDVYERGRLVRKETRIELDSPGSVFLVLQAILPFILFCSSPSCTTDEQSVPAPVRLTIVGGTNVHFSPSAEYVTQVLFPMLQLKLGIGPIEATLKSRGWSLGRARCGEVVFDITPLAPGSVIPAFEFVSENKDTEVVRKVLVSILAPDTTWRDAMRDRATREILRRWPDADIEFPVDENSGSDKRLYLLLVAETSEKYRLGRDWIYDRKINPEKVRRTVEELVGRVVGDLAGELESGGEGRRRRCVDEYLRDQLVVFQALAKGKAVVCGGGGGDDRDEEGSLHTKTARWVAESICRVEWDEQRNCEGIGLVAGGVKGEDGGTEELAGV